MNCEKIGEAAGAVWAYLRDSDTGCGLGELKKIPGFTSDEIVAGIGWLAREGKIEFQAVRGKRTMISLIEAELCV